jgi:hypothetical protein
LGLYVIITSKSDGSAIFVKQVAVLTRLEKSKTSNISFQLKGYVPKMNLDFIQYRSYKNLDMENFIG